MAPPPLSEARRITVLWVGRLGDLLVSTPFLYGLRAAAPKARIVLVTAQAGEGGARMLDCVDQVHVVRKGKDFMRNFGIFPDLRRESDLLIDLNSAPSATAVTITRLCKARTKATFRRGGGDSAFNFFVDAPTGTEHMLERYARLARGLGFATAPRMRVPVSVADGERALQIAASLPSGRRRVALFPGNFKKNENRWPEDDFALLAERLAADPGLAPYWLAGPGERPQVEAAAAISNVPLPVLGPFPLGVSAAVLGVSSLYIGNCTGVSHLAVCVGTPTFTVLAGYTAAVWAPPGEPGPENPHWRVVAKDWESCREVTVDEAWDALQPALAAVRSASAA
ncbi:MAG: glycosyltransferase family 9 protein [Elusimicrobia bacterium]|nr:glycosyltransferase family 9 protein [Elusimicrobiota bacterium]